MIQPYLFLIFIFFIFSPLLGGIPQKSKVLICGVCRNIEGSVYNTMKQMQMLGDQFLDYKIIIYENNSADNTAQLFKEFSLVNKKFTFLSENVSEALLLSLSRTEKIARARNIVLSEVRKMNYKDFEYLIMADLDFQTPWPINEILNTIKSPIKWDCVSANGIREFSNYWDRYAYRNETYPLGPELLGDRFWADLHSTWFSIENEKWLPVYSAFGGLAIYKTESIIKSSYSGKVDNNLKRYYKKIVNLLPKTNPQIQQYIQMIGYSPDSGSEIPIYFQQNTLENSLQTNVIKCCEHVPLHASMALQGYGKFFINPKLIMRY